MGDSEKALCCVILQAWRKCIEQQLTQTGSSPLKEKGRATCVTRPYRWIKKGC
jgi:hypothetical protein